MKLINVKGGKLQEEPKDKGKKRIIFMSICKLFLKIQELGNTPMVIYKQSITFPTRRYNVPNYNLSKILSPNYYLSRKDQSSSCFFYRRLLISIAQVLINL